MEFMEKGNLLYFIKGPEGADLQLETLQHIWQQIAGGMVYLENANIIHRLVFFAFPTHIHAHTLIQTGVRESS